MDRRSFVTSLLAAPQVTRRRQSLESLAAEFRQPPASARPWVYWFWINGNISKQGITADLEAFQQAGIGGVLWMEVSGPWWAPDGPVTGLSAAWHEAMQWAVAECRRLGLEFDLSVDFGYGSGGPHITPELSMQQLVWSEVEVEGGGRTEVRLEKPNVPKNTPPWLRPGASLSAKVQDMLDRGDSYRDVAVLAMPAPASPEAVRFRIPELPARSGLHWYAPRQRDWGAAAPSGAAAPAGRVLDLTTQMDESGRLSWQAPAGRWLILRFGHATNFKMTRPCPAAAVGLECDRLAKAGIETHYEAFLKKIIAGAGSAAGGTLSYIHIDSWEAGGQNWTSSFPAEFRARRGYDVRPWLPVLTGRVVESPGHSERFLWDMRATVSEMIRDNYAERAKSLARAQGVQLSIEAYGHLCIDNLAYAGLSGMPVSEFWARGEDKFPAPGPGGYEQSSKAMASAAHIYGRRFVGAEAFTSGRAWRDHPYLLKAMGDKAFSRGVNRLIFHLSAHQAYDTMVPGLTHRRWGEHFQRFNTWWSYSRPYIDYLARCQYLLQAGTPAADLCILAGEGAPISVDEIKMDAPAGYDFDVCPGEALLRASVRGGRIQFPSGASYSWLVLREAERLTLPLARKIQELASGGARIAGGPKPAGTPGLSGYPSGDAEVRQIAARLWDGGRIRPAEDLAAALRKEGLPPDFEGEGLIFIHRRVGDAEIYFVAYQDERPAERVCTFRVSGKQPGLWDPETGAVRALPDFREREGRISIPLQFGPMQSWFVVFRSGRRTPAGRANFAAPRLLRPIEARWSVTFDPRWGGPDRPVEFAGLVDWSKHADPRIHHYSGTATYRTSITLTPDEAAGKGVALLLDLGGVEVMARVRLNGQECGVAWKPPYRVDVSRAARAGANELEIDAVNLWINRMIGDEQLPEDSNWKDFETLLEWPEWFKTGRRRPSGRYTFTSAKHYKKDSPLAPSGLLGPVALWLDPSE